MLNQRVDYLNEAFTASFMYNEKAQRMASDVWLHVKPDMYKDKDQVAAMYFRKPKISVVVDDGKSYATLPNVVFITC